MPKNKLILLRGLPGAGKTTLAQYLEQTLGNEYSIFLFSADDFFTSQAGTYTFDAAKLGAAHAWCRESVYSMMFQQDCYHPGELVLVVHNTSTTEKELKPYLDLADQHNFEVISLIVENRHGGLSYHGVPEETLAKMKERFSVKL